MNGVEDPLFVYAGDPTGFPYRFISAVFSQTETCDVLASVNGSRVHPAHRSRRVMPARRAIKSSSEGQT